MLDDDALIEVVSEVIDDLKLKDEYKVTIHINDMEQIIDYVNKLKNELSTIRNGY